MDLSKFDCEIDKRIRKISSFQDESVASKKENRKNRKMQKSSQNLKMQTKILYPWKEKVLKLWQYQRYMMREWNFANLKIYFKTR